MYDRFVAEMWGMASPDHVCACPDDDLSQARLPLGTPDGLWVDLSCGHGHRRRIRRRAWDAELARRRSSQQAQMPAATGVPAAEEVAP